MAACPSETDFLAFTLGRLETQAAEELQRHLDVCPDCFALFAELARGTRSPHELREPPPAATTPQAEAQGRASPWTPPRHLDEYHLLHPIGRGAVGQVWLARDDLLDRLVAIKFLAAESNPDAHARFRREARAIARLSHPNVVTIHRVGMAGDHPYLVSEFVRGESLDRLSRPMPWWDVLELGVGLARGLAAAHRAGVLHRDIKPANAIVAEGGEVKLLDFGLAKLLDATHSDKRASIPPLVPPSATSDTSPASLTATGMFIGTPLYMAPEAWDGTRTTARMDVYSLGAVLYELCAGEPPHGGKTLGELRHAILKGEPAPLASRVAGVDVRFASIVMRCLRRDPETRFASGEELCWALEAALPTPVRKSGALRGRWLALAALAAAGAVAGLFLWNAARHGARGRPVTRAASSRCSADGWCWDANWQGRLEGTWGSAPDDVWAVGERGRLEHFDGRSWSAVDAGTIADLYSVHGTGRDDVWVVGDWGALLHFDGRAWRAMRADTRTLLTDVWSAARDDVWAVAYDGSTLHWDGAVWGAVPSGTVKGLLRVAGSGPRDVWAVGGEGTVIHWDGTRWTPFDVESHEFLNGLWVAGPQDAWLVGFHSVVRHWDGKRWQRVPLPDFLPADDREDHPFNAVAGSAPNDVWLLSKRAPFLHWNGTRLERVEPGTERELFRIYAAGARDAFAVGADGTRVRWDGHAWSGPPDPPYVQVRGVWGRASDDVWGAGLITDSNGKPRGHVLHFDGTRWQAISVADVPILRTVGGGAIGGGVWVAGDDGVVLGWNGREFVREPTPTKNRLRGLFADGADTAWAVGDRGTILRRSGGVWRAVASGTSAALDGVWASGAGDVWVVGADATILRGREGAFAVTTSGTRERLWAIWGAAADDVWAVGERGAVVHWDGAAWSPAYSDTPEHLLGVWGSGSDDVWAVSETYQSYRGTIIHWNGKFWTALNRTPRAVLTGVWAGSRRDAWAVGPSWTLLRYQP